jgi:DNA-directed RNA polymerase specialized sigma24 family protein
VLAATESLVYRLVRYHQKRLSLDEHDVQDLASRVQEWLWQKSLPSFDVERETKVATFLHTCIQNCLGHMLRDLMRQRDRQRLEITMPSVEFDNHESNALYDPPVPDETIVGLAEDIRLHPERYLTNELHLRVFRLVNDNRDVPKKELAVLMGYTSPSSLSRVLGQIRQVLSEVDFDVP